jgi:hydroxypyruvate isomerase
MRFTVNGSILLTELPLLERPAAVRAAGFDALELWWPYATATPEAEEVDALVEALDRADTQLTGLNFYAGDMPGGDRGLVSWPGREADFLANLDVVTAIGERTGCRAFNALYGNRQPGVEDAEQDDLAVRNLAAAAQAVGRIGGTVLVEPVSGMAAYPLKTAAQAIAVIDRVAAEHGATNLGLLLDVYHLAVNGDDVDAVIATHRDRIAHVQVADAPGRDQPGTGELPIGTWMAALETGGYEGWIGLEYKPATPRSQADPFGWLPSEQRAAR